MDNANGDVRDARSLLDRVISEIDARKLVLPAIAAASFGSFIYSAFIGDRMLGILSGEYFSTILAYKTYRIFSEIN